MCQCGFSFYRMNPGDEPQVLRLGVSKVIKKDKRTRGQATPIAHYSGETLRRRDLQSSKSESTTGLTESRTYRGGRKRGLIFFFLFWSSQGQLERQGSWQVKQMSGDGKMSCCCYWGREGKNLGKRFTFVQETNLVSVVVIVQSKWRSFIKWSEHS